MSAKDPPYLTPPLKEKELSDFYKKLEDWRKKGSPTGAGIGWPDPEILPWCEKINEIEGICTLQSCAGHPANKHDYIHPGQLWLWMTGEKSFAFEKVALDLAAEDGIETVRKLYQHYGRVIIDIVFKGQGTGDFDKTMSVILKYLQSIVTIKGDNYEVFI